MTYYVVAHEWEIYYLLLPIATLPAGYIEYSNPQESEGIIRISFVKKRGVYLWTNKINGQQYAGSAMDLSSRLSDYFTNSYIKYQSTRGSVISAAILKYGLSQFSLQVIVLGPSPTRDTISVNKKDDCYYYTVGSIKELKVIIDHFDKYPLITQKQADFKLFKSVAELVNKKEHLTIEGLKKIVNIRASMNLGLSDVLKTAFPNTVPAPRPKVEATEKPDPNWLAGFTDGEGCFYIGIFDSKKYKLGAVVQLCFSISQHSRDANLIGNIINTLGCGRLKERQKKSSVEFVVTSLWEIVEKIVPFFDKYPLCKEGLKMLDYVDFCKVVQLLKEDAHLTEEGLNKIRKIKSEMRIRRIKSIGGDENMPISEIDTSAAKPQKIFVYDSSTLTFSSVVYGYERLANLLGIHVNTARRAVKSGGVYANKYILSLSELDKENIKASPSFGGAMQRCLRRAAIKNNVKPKSTAIKVVHVYNKDKSVLLKTFPSVNAFMSFSKQSGYNTKLLCTTDILWLGEYFLSYDLIASADNSLANSEEFKPILRNRTTSIPVYTYSADGKTFIKRYSSLRECVKELDGNRNTNTSTLELRIEHKELYHGLRVYSSRVPIFDHDK